MENLEKMINENDQTNENNSVFNTSFQPQNEEQLIEFAKWLKSREHHSVIKTRWTLGKKINESGGFVYGENTAGRIAEEVGYAPAAMPWSIEAITWSDADMNSAAKTSGELTFALFVAVTLIRSIIIGWHHAVDDNVSVIISCLLWMRAKNSPVG